MPGYHNKKKKPAKKMMGGGMMYKDGGTTKKKMKKKKLAAMYGNPHKITRGDIITAAKKKAKTAVKGAAKVMGAGLAAKAGQMMKKRKK
jgi:hypothetical protein